MRCFVWLLASSSFASLLSELYGLLPMSRSWWLLSLPGLIGLILIAWRFRSVPPGPGNPYSWIVGGTLAGLIAAVVYDLFRVPFVMAGYPLFNVFPRFGQMLLANPDDTLAAHLAGWAYHFSNGAALGIMFYAMLPHWRNRLVIIAGAIVWALVVEGLLLLSPYYAFFRLHLPYGMFIALTLSAHAVFGIALGVAVQRWTQRIVSASESPGHLHT